MNTTDGDQVRGEAIVPADLIDVRPGGQHRTGFDTAELEALARTIDADGLIARPTVRPIGARFEIVAGERRVRAMRDVLEWADLPVIVRELDDQQAARIMLTENVARVDLDPVDEARAYRAEIDRHEWSIAETARIAGVPPARVRGRLELLELAPDTLHWVSRRAIPLGHAASMIGLDANRQHLALAAYESSGCAANTYRELCTRLRDEQAAEDAEGMFDAGSFLRVAEYVRDAEDLVRADEPAPTIIREPVWGPDEIGSLLGVKRGTVAAWRQRGIFPAADLRVSGRDLWYQATVETWAADNDRALQPAMIA